MGDAVAAIVRLCYFPEAGADELFRRRLEYFAAASLPRLLAQSEPTDVYVWVHPRHRAEAEAALAGTPARFFDVDLVGPSLAFAETEIRGYPWSAVSGLPRYAIQVLLGSDDLLAPDFVRVSLAALAGAPEPRALATHYPLALEAATGRCFAMPRWPRPSPFVVLRQPTARRSYTWVWARSHNHLHHVVERVVHLEPGLALMTINADNDSTRIGPSWPEVPRPAWL